MNKIFTSECSRPYWVKIGPIAFFQVKTLRSITKRLISARLLPDCLTYWMFLGIFQKYAVLTLHTCHLIYWINIELKQKKLNVKIKITENVTIQWIRMFYYTVKLERWSGLLRCSYSFFLFFRRLTSSALAIISLRLTITGKMELGLWTVQLTKKTKHAKPDKFENATSFSQNRSPVHTKTAFSVPEDGTFWKLSPKWINLKTPTKCISVDGENGTFWKRLCDNSHIISVAISTRQRFSVGSEAIRKR